MVSPQYRETVQLTVGRNSTNTECEGVNPNFEQMRRMYPMAGGRFLNEVDVARQRRVLVLGARSSRSPCSATSSPWGRTSWWTTCRSSVVGVLQKKMQTSMNNGPDDERAVIPYLDIPDHLRRTST